MPATPAWPPRSAPRLFVDQALSPGTNLNLEGPQAHYLARVMRVRPGDAVVVCDNQTGEWAASVIAAGKRDVSLSMTKMMRPREQVPDFWLCPSLLKKDRFDLVLEKATELGAARISPIITRRCVADKLNGQRAKIIVTEAAEQCARTALPELDQPVKLSSLLEHWPPERTLFFADELGGRNAAKVFAETPGPTALITGPEGGFDDAERKLLTSHPNVQPITLGPRILRGETAALAAVSLWMGIAGDWQAEGK